MRDLDNQAALFSQGPVVVFRWRLQEGWPVDHVTENVEAVFGYSAEEFLSGAAIYAEIVYPDDLDRVAAEVARHVESGRDRFQHEDYRIVHRNGDIRWLQDFTVLQRDADGIVQYAIGYVVDVTGRREIEEDLRRARQKLENLVAIREDELSREIAKLEQSESLRQRENDIRRSLSQAAIQFLESGDWTEIIDGVIETLGQAANVDRVYVFQNSKDENGNVLTTLRHEWCLPGVDPQIDNPEMKEFPFAEGGFSRWIEILAAGKVLYGLVEDLPALEKPILQAQGIVALLAVPVFVEGELWGFIGFDDCHSKREWSDGEIQILKLVAGALATAIRRRADQQALRESNHRLRGAVASMQEGFALFDAEDRLVLYNDTYEQINPAAAISLERPITFEELLRANVERGMLADAEGQESRFLDDRLTRHGAPGEPIIRNFGDGRVCLIKETRTPDGGTALTFIDITELQQANAALEQAKTDAENSRALLEGALESAPDAFALYDSEGRLMKFNQAWKHLYRHSPEVLKPGIKFEDIVRDRVRLGLAANIGEEPEAWIKNRMRQFFEGQDVFENRFPDGTWWQIHERRTPRGDIVQIAMEITKIRAREEALRDSEERFRSIFENATAGVAIADLDNRYKMVNQALSDILGYSVPELMQKTTLDVTHPYDMARTAENQGAFYRGEIDTAVEEKRYVRKDGETVWAIVNTSVVRDSEGRPMYTIRSVQDITERKKAEEAAVALQSQLAHVSRVSTMGELAAGFAHELNQPLAAISNFAIGTLRRYRSDAVKAEDMSHVLELIVEQARRAADIIRRIRQFIQKEPPETKQIDVNLAITEAADLVKGEALAFDMTIETDLDAGLPQILGDEIQLQQLIVNLARNGLEAMQDAPNSDRRLMIRTKATESGDVRVSVADTGIGFSDEIRERIFDPFFSTKTSGMGMGLSICRSIAEAHGGRMTVESEPDVGTTFHVILGASAAEMATNEKSDRPGN
ncbi:MAG: PAS domain S-box protein [Rhodospirillales bacterium]|nr:PAS domain S-box protein [Rhodospirillales bacterium]